MEMPSFLCPFSLLLFVSLAVSVFVLSFSLLLMSSLIFLCFVKDLVGFPKSVRNRRYDTVTTNSRSLVKNTVGKFFRRLRSVSRRFPLVQKLYANLRREKPITSTSGLPTVVPVCLSVFLGLPFCSPLLLSRCFFPPQKIATDGSDGEGQHRPSDQSSAWWEVLSQLFDVGSNFLFSFLFRRKNKESH